ncbi:peroxisomal membrane protein PEX16-like [Asterias rubens]|uniref:peroxisomal membrane protein PEX16-like n=1 Tax=Asterias rubens TaxID=7604 RepID=UPI001454ECE2|nr:peroxisomal membrane protein PEX16-like [Asterias rubens]
MEACNVSGCRVWDIVLERYKKAWRWYENWVSENPDVVSQIEKIFRVFSYLLPGAVNVDTVAAELVFSISNLLVLFHDGILRQARGLSVPCLNISAQRLMRWLTVIDHTEVFVEMAAAKSWGEAGRWFFISIIQILRSIFRWILLYKHKSGLQAQPPIKPLNRETELTPSSSSQGMERNESETPGRNVDKETEAGNSGVTFKGGRSGRVVRLLDAAPDIQKRTWRLPSIASTNGQDKTPQENEEPSELLGIPLAGESLQIARPLLHLTSLFVWGQQSWKPWLLSLAADIASLQMLQSSKHYNESEKKELGNRSLMLLLYLLRSPCYDLYTRSRLLGALKSLSGTIPGAGLILKPLMEYLPIWQGIYFYNWGR